jgi:hypothetical protein
MTNGGSEPVGAKGCRNDTFAKDCATATNTLKYSEIIAPTT